MNWTVVASLIAALAAVAGVVFTGLSLQTTRAQIALTEQGQLSDRYGKAIDQLDRTGPEHLQGRFGAIYAHERLARDSPRDQPTIIEVLSAFIRATTPALTPSTCFRQAVAPDIEAALTVLGRRDPPMTKPPESTCTTPACPTSTSAAWISATSTSAARTS